MKVAALILTYNRLDLLKGLLEAIEIMSVRPNHTFIVDNNSTDGTGDFLGKLDSDDITVFIKSTNTGSAGGFNFGITKFIESEYDFIWILDDDGMPTLDCLKNLKLAYREGIHFYSSWLKTGDGRDHFDIELVPGQILYDHRGGPFNSILVTRRLIEIAGNVREDLFIWGDEYEWLTRIENLRLHKVLVSDSIHIHKSTAFNLSNVPRVYYLVRNRIIIWKTLDGRIRNKSAAFFGLTFFIGKLLIGGLSSLNLFQVREVLKGIWAGLNSSK